MTRLAHQNGERLLRLVNDILDVSQLEAGKLPMNVEKLSLIQLVAQALENNRAYAEQFGVEFRLGHTLPDSFNIRADAQRVLQVLNQLLTNAAKFSPASSQVLVSVVQAGSALRSRSPGSRGRVSRSTLLPKYLKSSARLIIPPIGRPAGRASALTLAKLSSNDWAVRSALKTIRPRPARPFILSYPTGKNKSEPELSGTRRVEASVVSCYNCGVVTSALVRAGCFKSYKGE